MGSAENNFFFKMKNNLKTSYFETFILRFYYFSKSKNFQEKKNVSH